MSKGPAAIAGTVTIEFEGREISASYGVAWGMVTVHTDLGSNAHMLARLMLRELAIEGKA